MTLAVEIKDVFRVHSTPEGDAAALQGLTLSVREGEVVTVLGPSGSGKTTLLRILGGLDRPSAGSVRVFGTELARLSAGRLAAYRTHTLGYADQHYALALAPELTARELVALPLGLRGAARRDRLERADELLDRVGLSHKRGSRPTELSGGEQQRIAVCAALVHRPRLFLADEPTGELDAANAELVYGAIGELAREAGCAVLVVSHDPESATIADRVIRVRDGRVSGETSRHATDGEGIVVGRGGWLRLPEELLARAGIRSHATARLADEGIVVSSQLEQAAPSPEAPAARVRLVKPAGTVAELRGVVKRFGLTTVFEGLDAPFEAGTFHAVTGPSGSGKTTLLHLVAGLELPDGGEVVALGRNVSQLDRTARAVFRREHVALVRQEVGLVSFLSARENIELGLAVRGVEAGEARRRALEALDAVGLTERAEQRVLRLSTGERGRVAIARAVAARPALLLADEPSSRLDQANALAVAALFSSLARDAGATVICATHDPLVIEQADAELPLRGAASASAALAAG